VILHLPFPTTSLAHPCDFASTLQARLRTKLDTKDGVLVVKDQELQELRSHLQGMEQERQEEEAAWLEQQEELRGALSRAEQADAALDTAAELRLRRVSWSGW